MTRNLKALGLALMAVFAVSAVAAQGALAVNHEFHAAKEESIMTGENTNVHEFAVGAAGTVKCNKATFSSTTRGALVSTNTYKKDILTVRPEYSECTFGGNPATVNFEHCDYEFKSDTTSGNSTGGEHATVKLKCVEGNSVKITTSICTLTVGDQTIEDAVRYENNTYKEGEVTKKDITVIATAHGVVVGNLGDKAGCALVPKGAVGKYIGTTTSKCYEDTAASTPAEGTAETTPTVTQEGNTIDCTVNPG